MKVKDTLTIEKKSDILKPAYAKTSKLVDNPTSRTNVQRVGLRGGRVPKNRAPLQRRQESDKEWMVLLPEVRTEVIPNKRNKQGIPYLCILPPL